MHVTDIWLCAANRYPPGASSDYLGPVEADIWLCFVADIGPFCVGYLVDRAADIWAPGPAGYPPAVLAGYLVRSLLADIWLLDQLSSTDYPPPTPALLRTCFLNSRSLFSDQPKTHRQGQDPTSTQSATAPPRRQSKHACTGYRTVL